MNTHRFCRQPDRDVPRLTCGYPLPCPHHTAIIEGASVTVPLTMNPLKVARLQGVARALDPGLEMGELSPPKRRRKKGK